MSNANGPAYPEIKTEAAYDEDGRGVLYANTYSVGGLTKRERAAIVAMQGLLAGGYFGTYSSDDVAKMAVSKADALLAELERTKC